eukprot:1158782-Pelagomonas_calceolata.AAC.5
MPDNRRFSCAYKRKASRTSPGQSTLKGVMVQCCSTRPSGNAWTSEWCSTDRCNAAAQGHQATLTTLTSKGAMLQHKATSTYNIDLERCNAAAQGHQAMLGHQNGAAQKGVMLQHKAIRQCFQIGIRLEWWNNGIDYERHHYCGDSKAH